MEEYYTTAIQSSLHHYDYFTAQWLAEQLVDHCILNNSHQSIKIPASIQLARVFIAQGEFPRALSILTTLPKTEEVLYYLCHCYLQLTQYDQADPLLLVLIPALEQLITRAKEIFAAHRLLPLSTSLSLPDVSAKSSQQGLFTPSIEPEDSFSYQTSFISQRHLQITEIASISFPSIKYNLILILSTFTPLLAHSYRIKGTIERRLSKFTLANASFKHSLQQDSTLWTSFQNLCELKIESSESLVKQIPELFFNCKEHVPIFYQSPLATIISSPFPSSSSLSQDQLTVSTQQDITSTQSSQSAPTQLLNPPSTSSLNPLSSLSYPAPFVSDSSHQISQHLDTPRTARSHSKIPPTSQQLTPIKPSLLSHPTQTISHSESFLTPQRVHPHHLSLESSQQLINTPNKNSTRDMLYDTPNHVNGTNKEVGTPNQVGLVFTQPHRPASSISPSHSTTSHQHSSQSPQRSYGNAGGNSLTSALNNHSTHSTQTSRAISSQHQNQTTQLTPPKRLVDEIDMIHQPMDIPSNESKGKHTTVLEQRTYSKLRKMNADLSDTTHTTDKHQQPNLTPNSLHLKNSLSNTNTDLLFGSNFITDNTTQEIGLSSPHSRRPNSQQNQPTNQSTDQPNAKDEFAMNFYTSSSNETSQLTQPTHQNVSRNNTPFNTGIHTNVSYFTSSLSPSTNVMNASIDASPVLKKVNHHYRSSWQIDQHQRNNLNNTVETDFDQNQQAMHNIDIDEGEGYETLQNQRMKRTQLTPRLQSPHTTTSFPTNLTENQSCKPNKNLSFFSTNARNTPNALNVSNIPSFQRIHNMYATNQFELQSMFQQQYIQQYSFQQIHPQAVPSASLQFPHSTMTQAQTHQPDLQTSSFLPSHVPICLRGGVSSLYASIYASSFFSSATDSTNDIDFIDSPHNSASFSAITTILPQTRQFLMSDTTKSPNKFNNSSNQELDHSHIYNTSLLSPTELFLEIKCHVDYIQKISTAYVYATHFDFINAYQTLLSLTQTNTAYDIISSLLSTPSTKPYNPLLQHHHNKTKANQPNLLQSKYISNSASTYTLPYSFKRLKYISVSNTLFYMYIYGMILSNINESSRAAEVFHQLHHRYNWNVKGMDLYSNQLHLLGNAAVLGSLASHLTTIAPRSYESLITLGNHFSLQKQSENAIRCFALATTTNNNNINNNCHNQNIDQSYPFLLLGYEYQSRVDQLDKAILSFHRVISIDPFNFKALLSLAQIALNEENHERAIGYFKQALQINKYSLHTYIEFAKMYGQLGMFKDSKEILFKALQCAYDLSLYLDFTPSIFYKIFNTSLANPNSSSNFASVQGKNKRAQEMSIAANNFLNNLPQRGFFANKIIQQLKLSSIPPGENQHLDNSTTNHMKTVSTKSILPAFGSKRLQIYQDSQDSSGSAPNDAIHSKTIRNGTKGSNELTPHQIIPTLDEPYNLIQLRNILSHILFTPSTLPIKSSPSKLSNSTTIAAKSKNSMNDDSFKVLPLNKGNTLDSMNEDHKIDENSKTPDNNGSSPKNTFMTHLCTLMTVSQHTLSQRLLLPLFIYIIHHCEETIMNIQTTQQAIDNYDFNNPHHYLQSQTIVKQQFISDKYHSIIPYINSLYQSISFIMLLLSIQPEEATFLYVLAKLHYSLHNIFNWSMKVISLYTTYKLRDLQQLHMIEYNSILNGNGDKHQENNNDISSISKKFNAPLAYINHEQLALNHITSAINIAEMQNIESQSLASSSLSSLSPSLLGPSIKNSKDHAIIIATTRQGSTNAQTGTSQIDFHHPNNTSSSTSTATLSEVGRSFIELNSVQLSFNNHTQSVAEHLHSIPSALSNSASTSLHPTQLHLNSLYNSAQNDTGFSGIGVQLPYTISSNNNNLNSVAANHYNLVCINPQQQIKTYTFNHRLYKLLQIINEQSFIDVGLYGVVLDA